MNLLKKHLFIVFLGKNWIKQAQALAQTIAQSGTSHLLLLIHPSDIFWSLALGMLSQICPDLQTYFYDYADYRFSLNPNLCKYYVCFRKSSLHKAKEAGIKHLFIISIVASTEFGQTYKLAPSLDLPETFTFGVTYTSDLDIDYFDLLARGLAQNPNYFHVQVAMFLIKKKKEPKASFTNTAFA